MNFKLILFYGLILSVKFYQINCQDYLLNCSAYSLNINNATIRRLGWNARLHACFEDNPYDLTQPPIPFGYPPINLQYDYSVIYVISFEGNKISLMGQLVLVWTDFYRLWDINQIPLEQIQLPISEIWYPQVNFISSITKRNLQLFKPDDQAVFSALLYQSFVLMLLRATAMLTIIDFHSMNKLVCSSLFSNDTSSICKMCSLAE